MFIVFNGDFEHEIVFGKQINHKVVITHFNMGYAIAMLA